MLFIFGIGHGVSIIPLTTVTKGTRAKIGNTYIKAGRIVEKKFLPGGHNHGHHIYASLFWDKSLVKALKKFK